MVPKFISLRSTIPTTGSDHLPCQTIEPSSKKRRLPVGNRHASDESAINTNISCDGEKKGKRKKIRRSVKKRKENAILNIMYSNIQGVTKKRESLVSIMEDLNVDICLLAETMTRCVKLSGCRCFTANKSIGQNVCVIVRNKIVDNEIIKLYEPNETINLIGIRIELMNSCLRVFTAHLKQQSVSTRDEIKAQFEEIRKQFQNASNCNEGMLLVLDANVHVGKEVIKGGIEDQDWGGSEFMNLVEDENLVLMNVLDLCSGIITRVDPRNGKGSTIDLALCNQFLVNKVKEMKIDEEGLFKPTNYTPVLKKTDHNSIFLKVEINRVQKMKPQPYVNLSDKEGKEAFKSYMENLDLESYLVQSENEDLQKELDVIDEVWSDAIRASFKKVTPKRKHKPGISGSVRELMREERWIRENIAENPERGRQIAEVRKRISEEIELNRKHDIFQKVNGIQSSKNPQGEIFKIRRERKRAEKVGFPLKDKDGNVQVNKMGIDKVIRCHFENVFQQNPVPEGSVWVDYWKTIDEVFQAICDEEREAAELPTFDEIKTIILMTDDKKAVQGTMKSELVKLGGDPLIRLVHRFVTMCCENEDIPDGLRAERMVLLYKNSGPLPELDNYRGIFIRFLLLSILQKWLYSKCSPVVDGNGSEYAFGGRRERSVKEVLLIVRLIQDYSHWTKQPLILKFLDITKFFDSMNYKKCLIEAYRSGLRGKHWNLYKNINKQKECTPVTPLGEGASFEIKEVFLQGSCDAMVMAWNLVDAINKRDEDFLEPVVIICGVKIPRVLFVDDVLEVNKSFMDLRVSNVGNECFERTNRVDLKPSKCKAICSNCEKEETELDGAPLEIVDEHKYVGTLVADKGRKSDLKKRINDCKGVLNEITEICKVMGVSEVRMNFVLMLVNSCFALKFKHGCEVWDRLNKAETITVNNLVPDTLKRILEVPRSTPTTAVIHEMGIVDLDLEICMERILLAVKVKKMDCCRVVKQLFEAMFELMVPGYCSLLKEDLQLFGIDDLEFFKEISDERKTMKKMTTRLQHDRLVTSMMKGSKTDALLLNFSYDGKMKEYFHMLPFHEARIIFLLRSRMLPTKVNFPSRWSTSLLCNFCCKKETDEHLFWCCGYIDLHKGELDHGTFMKLDCTMNELSQAARTLIKIHDRLLQSNEGLDGLEMDEQEEL